MTKKKLIQYGAIAVAAIWVFCISFLIASGRVKKQRKEAQALSGSSFSAVSSSAAASSESTATQPKVSMNGNQVSTNVSVSDPAWVVEESKSKQASEAASLAEQIRDSSKAAAKSAVPSGKGEVLAAYIQAVNKLKSTQNFTLVKQDILSVDIDSISGGSSVQNIASSLIKNNTNTDPVTYNFSAGSDPSTGKSPTAVIAPLGSEASLSPNIVTSAQATENSSGGYKLTIKLGQAVQTLTSPAEGYSTSMEVINTESLGLPSSASISTLNITYDNSTIEAEIDKDGRITSMKHTLVVSKANGEGKMLVPITVELHGNYVSDYKISY